MGLLINNFFNSKYFVYLPNFVKRKLRKINSIYFILTKYKKLPNSNYNEPFSYSYQEFIIKNYKTSKYISKNSYKNLKKLILKYNLGKNKILDFGAGDINTYLDLIKLKNLKYYYYDINSRRIVINKIVKKFNFKNIFVTKNPLIHKFNFIFFGSALGYIKNYKKILDKIVVSKCKFVLISGIILFEKKNFKPYHVCCKQLNTLPRVNYLYFFNKKKLLDFFKENDYEILFLKKNQFKKISFKNLDFFSNNIEYVDILFKKKN